jgi:hypothetical protein
MICYNKFDKCYKICRKAVSLFKKSMLIILNW